MVLLLGLGGILAKDRLQTANDAAQARRSADVATAAMQLRDELQNEGRQAAVAINVPGNGLADYVTQKRITDAAATKLKAAIPTLPSQIRSAQVVQRLAQSVDTIMADARRLIDAGPTTDLEVALATYDVLDEAAAAAAAALTNVGGSATFAARSAEVQASLVAKGDFGRQIAYPLVHLNSKPLGAAEGAEYLELVEVTGRSLDRLKANASVETNTRLFTFLGGRKGDVDQFGRQFVAAARTGIEIGRAHV